MSAKPERGSVVATALCDHCGTPIYKNKHETGNQWFHQYNGNAACPAWGNK